MRRCGRHRDSSGRSQEKDGVRIKGASLTGGEFGQTKLRKGWEFGKGERRDGRGQDGRSWAPGSKLERKGPTRQAEFGLEKPAQWTGRVDQPGHRATNPDEDNNTTNSGFERI